MGERAWVSRYFHDRTACSGTGSVNPGADAFGKRRDGAEKRNLHRTGVSRTDEPGSRDGSDKPEAG